MELLRESASDELGVCGGASLACCSRSVLLTRGILALMLPLLATAPPPPPPPLAGSGAPSPSFGAGSAGSSTGRVSLPELVAVGMPAVVRAAMEGLRLPIGGATDPSLSFLSASRSRWLLRWVEAKNEVERSAALLDLGLAWACGRTHAEADTYAHMPA